MREIFVPGIAASMLISLCLVQCVSAQTSTAAPSNGQVSSAPGAPTAISTPSNTVGNTPSSVRTGNQNSGYSAGGNTVNNNINNTQVGGRSAGQPIGAGSNTSRGYGNR